MNNSMHIDHKGHTISDTAASQSVSTMHRLYKGLLGLLFRSELEKSRAVYRAKQLRESPKQDVLAGFSMEQKLRHGMYKWMD